MELGDLLHQAVVLAVPLILAITLHEAAHGYVANLLGDPTAKLQGRLTLDPLKHVDPMGTVILPGMMLLSGVPFLFGYAKPVPVDMRFFQSPRRDMAIVALAGPFSNIAQAIIAALCLHLIPEGGGEASVWFTEVLIAAIRINCILAAFNLLPLPPLDGSRVLLWALPKSLVLPFISLERYGIMILLAVIALPPLIGPALGLDFSPLGVVLGPLVEALVKFVITVAGLT